MRKFSLGRECNQVVFVAKGQKWFPKKTGAFKNDFKSRKVGDNTFELGWKNGKISGRKFLEYSELAGYLDDGTQPHNIPMAFGRALPFGMSGRFDGNFHPGSRKHEYFFDGEMLHFVLKYFISRFGGSYRIGKERDL